MRTLMAALSLSVGLFGCSGDDSSSSETMTSAAVTSAGTTEETTTSVSASGEATTAGTTTAGTTSEGTTTAGTTGEETTTSGLEICHFGSSGGSGGSTDPWLELTHHGTPVEDGINIGLECGLQGLFMLELVPHFAGFEPEDEYVEISMTVDVEDYNLNPDGHFYSVEKLAFYIGCDVFDGGVGNILAVIPPDTIEDLTELEGAAGTLSVTLFPDGSDPVTVDASFTVGAEANAMWEFCGYVP